jgi:hypothetical protein
MTASDPGDPWAAVERRLEQEKATEQAELRQFQQEATAVADRISGHVQRFISEVRRAHGARLEAAINAQEQSRFTFTPESPGGGSYFSVLAGRGWAHWTTNIRGVQLYIRLDGAWAVNHHSGTEQGGYDNCVFGYDRNGHFVLSRAAFAHTSPQQLEQDILDTLVRGSKMPWRW